MENIINKDGLLNRMIHTHIYEDKGEYFQCPCGKRKLKLKETEIEGLRVGIRKDGTKCLVRDHRSRYFFPNEWNAFYETLKKEQKQIFDFLIQTGCRINEALHVRPSDFDFERDSVRLWKTKTRAKLNERSGKPRTISLSPIFVKRVKKYIKEKGLEEQSIIYLFKGEKENSHLTKQTISQLFKRKLVKSGIKDYWNFSLHNIRKTHGMYLKALSVPAEEICWS
jgi:integrase